jgi:hypothetical protein
LQRLGVVPSLFKPAGIKKLTSDRRPWLVATRNPSYSVCHHKRKLTGSNTGYGATRTVQGDQIA